MGCYGSVYKKGGNKLKKRTNIFRCNSIFIFELSYHIGQVLFQ